MALSAAAAGFLGQTIGSLSAQGRIPATSAGAGPRADTSTVAIAAARDRRTARLAAKNARAERLTALLQDPQIMGTLTVLGGLMVSMNMPFSADKDQNAAMRAIAAASCVLMGLGRAGVGDLTTLTVAGSTAAAALFTENAAPSESWWSSSWVKLTARATLPFWYLFDR